MKCSIAERLQFGPDGKVIMPKWESKTESSIATSLRSRLSDFTEIKRTNYDRNRHVRNSVESSVSAASSSSCSSSSSSSSLNSGGQTYKSEYTVEKILAHEVKNKRQMFLVKWLGWSQESNTWEPLENLTHCPRLLEEFLADTLAVSVVEGLKNFFEIEEEDTNNASLMQYLPKGGFNALPNRTQLQRQLLAIAATPSDKRNTNMRERGKRIMFSYLIHERRERQLVALKHWEDDINTTAAEDAVLKVENLVDLEEPPDGFVYINDYVPGNGIEIPDDPPIGCECEKCYGKANKLCCSGQSVFAYRGKPSRINVEHGIPIFECNKSCKCLPENCNNRVVQLGRKVPLCIFRTANGRGWGVRASRAVHRGEFVCEYVGEVISFEEAERRGQGYDAEGRTYLFDLDFNTNDFPYTVDAATYGNASHFINHSCNPNLGVWAVWVNCLDPNLPRLALFANRPIARGEEITFDYMSHSGMSSEDCQSNTPRKRLALPNGEFVENDLTRPQCKCEEKTCRRYLF